MACTVYSIGYERRTIEEFIEILQAAKVNILLDVREHPWSYKVNFRKNKLSAELAKAGIEYIHIPEAGNPKTIRKKYIKTETVLRKYKSYLEKTGSGLVEISDIIKIASKKGQNICLTCYERDYSSCHRSVITDALTSNAFKNKIIHL